MLFECIWTHFGVLIVIVNTAFFFCVLLRSFALFCVVLFFCVLFCILLLSPRRGSLYQRNECPTFTQKIYTTLLQLKNDDFPKITNANDAKIRAEKYGAAAIQEEEQSTVVGKNMIQPIELIDSLMPESIVETWSRRGRKECLVVEMYKEIRAQVMEIIKNFHKLGGTDKRNRYSELVRMSTIPIVSIGVIRVSTPIDFDDRVIPMHCEYHRKGTLGWPNIVICNNCFSVVLVDFFFFFERFVCLFILGRSNKSCLNNLERAIDECWDIDSTDPEDNELDSEEDIEIPIEGRMG